MACELCGGGDEWIKTCLTPEGSRLLICDGCYGENDSMLVIVPGEDGDGQVRPMLALRQPQGVRGGTPRRAQERLLGDVWSVRKGRIVTRSERDLHLPPGYRLDRSDPDVWTLRRFEGWVVAHFSARGATTEAIEEVAWEDHGCAGEEQYP